MILDATNLIVGRMATKVAKLALLGEKIDIVNCEKAVITGNKAQVLRKFKQRSDRGIPLQGPYIPRRSDYLVRRMIRGMLPYHQERGMLAFKRVMCYVGMPDEFKDQKIDTLADANISRISNLKYVTIKEISRFLGAK